MSLASDLLEQADHLARREHRRPKQASLRRAISAAYYSLFHLVVEDASRYLVASSRLRPSVARSFDHQAVRTAAAALAEISRRPTSTNWLRPHLSDPISPDLTSVCDTLVDLLDQRHRADYDTAMSFTRLDANRAVSTAINAHRLWPNERNTHNAQAFMLAAAKLLRTR